MKLVLVSCCAPCSAGAIKQLVDREIPGIDDFVVLFFNPNIYPMAEYEKRMAEQIRYCEQLGVKHVELEYDHDAWRDAVRGLEAEPERGARCSVCFEYRFRRAARWARENGYDAVASVLGVSRHKDQVQVDTAAEVALATPRHPTQHSCADMTPPARAVGIDASQTQTNSPRPGVDNYSTEPIPTAVGGGWCAAPGGGIKTTKLHTARYTQFALQQSKILKRNMTDAERLLWHYLRARRDFSFRKQAPIGNYIVDFVCISKKLIVELDGAQHGDATGRKHDEVRDNFLRDAGYRVLRFWNDQIFNDMDMVLDTIYRYLATPSHGVAVPAPAQAVAIPASQTRSKGVDNYSTEPIPTAVGGGWCAAPGGGTPEADIKYIPIKWDEALRQQIGRASDFYRQNYCGCEFSIRKV